MKREWTVDVRQVDHETGEAVDNRQAVVEALVEVEAIGHRLGGAFIVAPIREERVWPDGSREYVTTHWRFVHDSFMPAARRGPEPDGELEPVTVPDEWDEPPAEDE